MAYADEMKRTQEIMTKAIRDLSRTFTSNASSVISQGMLPTKEEITKA